MSRRFIRNLLFREDGPTSVEYAVMLMLIFSICFLGVQFVGQQLKSDLEDSSQQLEQALD